MNYRQLIEQAEANRNQGFKQVHEQTTKIENLQAQEEAVEKSKQAKETYLKDRAVYGLAYGRPLTRINNHLAQDSETALDLAARAIANKLYGVTQANGYFSFQGQPYSTVSDLADGLSKYLGFNLGDDDLADLLTASDLADPRERRSTILEVLKRQEPEMPDSLTWTDQMAVQALLGDL